ncbi:MAG: hypothetical protein RMJ39_08330 [Deltaproteobacteria bacterium]|nr:hypothetical protein [Deltaproteobacteria bacterium]
MRKKIFLAFAAVIFLALIFNLVFAVLIAKDFDSYVISVREDLFYWLLASLESAYDNGKWDLKVLSESVHWAMMLGFDVRVFDSKGREIISTREVVNSLSDVMKRRMEILFRTESADDG